MFEHGPFKDCPKCGGTACLGILSIGGQVLTRRCTNCRHILRMPLPSLDKKVIYLDQLAFSEIFKMKSGYRRKTAPSRLFWERAHQAVERVVLLQQAVFPTCNIHSEETLVFHRSVELRQACELIGGDVAFKDVPQVEAAQLYAFVDAFQQGRGAPHLNFDVDDILEDKRNVWLPDLHITTNMDMSIFADDLRKSRTAGSDALTNLVERWRTDKPTFETQLETELKGWGKTFTKTYVELNNRRHKAMFDGDWDAVARAAMHQVNILMSQLMAKFHVDRPEVSPQDRQQFVDFMSWEGLDHLPYHLVSAYLFAALARRYANGQKRLPSQGMLNDFAAIATYGPYVDAMFLDRECASLLAEKRLKTDLPLKGPVFSTATGDAFIEYLNNLSDNAPLEVKAYVKEIYGVE